MIAKSRFTYVGKQWEGDYSLCVNLILCIELTWTKFSFWSLFLWWWSLCYFHFHYKGIECFWRIKKTNAPCEGRNRNSVYWITWCDSCDDWFPAMNHNISLSACNVNTCHHVWNHNSDVLCTHRIIYGIMIWCNVYEHMITTSSLGCHVSQVIISIIIRMMERGHKILSLIHIWRCRRS